MTVSTSNTPEQYLKYHKLEVQNVVRVWSPGDSDFGYETFLWIDTDGHPWTSVIYGEQLVSVKSWNHFDPRHYL